MDDLVRRSDGRAAGADGAGWREGSAREDESLDVRRLVLLLLRRKWQVLLVTALIVGPAMIATALQQRLYRSTALLQVDPEPVQVLPYRGFEVPRADFELHMTTQEQVLTGPTLLSRVAARMEQGPDAALLAPEVAALKWRVSVQRLHNTQVFALSHMAARPEVAAKVANLFAEEYIKLQFQGQQEARERARRLLERELAQAEKQVQTSEEQLVAYAQSHDVAGARPDQSGLADQKLASLAAQMNTADSDIIAAEARVSALRSASIAQFPETLLTPLITARMSALLQLEHDLTALRTSYGENWPAVVQKRNEIALVREQLDRQKAATLAQALEQALMEQRTAQRKRSALEAAKSQQEQLVSALQGASIEYNILRRNVDTYRKLYEGLLERLKQMSVVPGMDLGGFRVIEPALADDTVASPRVWWNFFLASVLGLALGVCLVLAHDFWRNSLSTVEDVEHVTVLPVLAAIPAVRQAAPRGLWSSLRPARWLGVPAAAEPSTSLVATARSPDGQTALVGSPACAEAVRTLCASILLSRSERPPRVLVVTSTMPGEGKTTLAIELGRALAESGARTLLVECDLRRSRLGTWLGVGEEGGLSLMLSGHVPMARIHATPKEKLFMVAAGPSVPNPVALLSSDRMTAFLEDMSSSFHFVILDAPPVLPMADARVLGAKADGVVLVVRAGRTSRNHLKRVCSVLESSGSRVLGAVLNGVDLRDMDASYYGYERLYDAN
jgi:capsular exopolysaccharide synthesis family protein